MAVLCGIGDRSDRPCGNRAAYGRKDGVDIPPVTYLHRVFGFDDRIYRDKDPQKARFVRAEYMKNYTVEQSVKRRDKRGFLVDFLKGDELPVENRSLGQIYFVTFESPAAIRGNHYHTEKNEWFVVIRGKIRMVVKDLETGETAERILDGEHDEYERIYIPQKTIHAFQNLGDTAMMINYADKPYHMDDPDTHPYVLIKP